MGDAHQDDGIKLLDPKQEIEIEEDIQLLPVDHTEESSNTSNMISSSSPWASYVMSMPRGPDGRFSCPSCEYKIYKRGSMKSHLLQVHSSERPFKCDECTYSCKTKSRMKLHKQYVHTDLCPFKCQNCLFTCKTRSGLKQHMKNVHSTDWLLKQASTKKEHDIQIKEDKQPKNLLPTTQPDSEPESLKKAVISAILNSIPISISPSFPLEMTPCL